MRCFEIMEALHTMKKQYRQIFLISHESEIKEMFERVESCEINMRIVHG